MLAFCRKELKEYLYNDGKGADVPIKEIVKWRNKERRLKANAKDDAEIKLFQRSLSVDKSLDFSRK